MKTKTWVRHHKWLGIVVALFVVGFALSGILLNHRGLIENVNVSRRLMPSRYEFSRWNGGLVKGSLPIGADSLLLYGSNGAWLMDGQGRVSDFNRGLPESVDRRNVRRLVRSDAGVLFAVSPTDLYRYRGGRWEIVAKPADGERFADVEVRGDSIVLLSRSNLYLANINDLVFKQLPLAAPPELDSRTTLFRTVWMLHSGELFGLGGRLFVDLLGVAFIVLAVGGVLIPILRKRSGLKRFKLINIKLHKQIGLYSFFLLAALAITGWCLRPPVMVPLALTRTPALPYSSLDSPNPWHDKLRAVRYDQRRDDWLLSTSEGFFSMKEFGEVPTPETGTPPVSVMGVNVLEPAGDGNWLCGSFSGMYRWDRDRVVSRDYFTGEVADNKPGPPFGKFAVSGIIKDWPGKESVIDYYEGSDFAPQPDSLRNLPMSLWAFALEVHSGRIYIGFLATYVFIFLLGAAIFWILLSGYKIRPKHRR